MRRLSSRYPHYRDTGGYEGGGGCVRQGIALDQERTARACCKKISETPLSSHEVPTFAFSTEELQTVLLQLDQAIYNHEQWSKGLDRTLICKSHCDQRDVSPEAHRQCQFCQGYYTYASDKLQQLPAFIAIEAEHARMHELAARLLMAVAVGKTISPYEYDNFAQTLERLRLQLQSLKRELNERLYNRDPFTGANTRIGLLTELREQHELVKRRVQPCGLVMMDLDFFKAVNDDHGRPDGVVGSRFQTALPLMNPRCCERPAGG